MMRIRILPLVTIAMGVLAVDGLDALPGPDHETSVQAVEDGKITVRIRNEFRWLVNVQLVTKSGRKIDLGPVESGSSLVATIAESVLDGTEPLQLRARSSRGSRNHLSEPFVTDDTVRSRLFAATPGSLIEMHIGKELAGSRLWIESGRG